MTIEEAVRVRIASLAAVIAIAGTRVWLDVLPSTPTYPAIRVLNVSGEIERQHLRGPEGLTLARVQIDQMAREASGQDIYGTLADLDAAVYGDGLGRQASGLWGWIGNIGSPPLQIKGVTAMPRVRRFDPDEVRVLTFSRDYMIRYIA